MNSIDTYPLSLNLTHEWDDEVDTKIKASISSSLVHSSQISAREVANDISSAFKSGGNAGGFRDEVEDICIYTSKNLPANHISQDRLVEIVKALRQLPHGSGQPQWQYIFQTGSYLLIEAAGKHQSPYDKNITNRTLFLTIGAQGLCRLHVDTSENHVKRTYLRSLNAFMARLTREGLSDCSYQALQAFTQALETPEPYVTTRTMDMLIVYDWLRLAAGQLIEAEIKDAQVSGQLWDNKKTGFSEERWKFWSRRLEDIEKDAGYEAQAREAAGKAKDILKHLMDG